MPEKPGFCPQSNGFSLKRLLEKHDLLAWEKPGFLPKGSNLGYLTRFINDVVKHTLRPKTIASYTYLIETYILPKLGSVRLVKLRPDHLQNLY
jgi:hypothetical protein